MVCYSSANAFLYRLRQMEMYFDNELFMIDTSFIILHLIMQPGSRLRFRVASMKYWRLIDDVMTGGL